MRSVALVVLLLACQGGSRTFAADDRALPALHVEGEQVLAGDRPIRLRGINWGWWNLAGTRYVEEDMRSLAGWGANLARLAFYYDHLESADGRVVYEGSFERAPATSGRSARRRARCASTAAPGTSSRAA